LSQRGTRVFGLAVAVLAVSITQSSRCLQPREGH
jgi:hypothetical protein